MKKALALYVILALPMLAQVPKPSGGGGSGGSGSGTVSGTSGKAAVFTSSTAVGDGTDGYCFNVVGGTLNVDSACFPLKHTSASAPVDGSDACATGDLWYRTGTVEFYICTDGDTDDWTKIPTISSTDTLTNKTLTTPIITSYTVATLPGTPTTGFLAVVTDAATAGSCTSGSGSAVSLCRYNGSAWAGIGDGGGGGTNPTLYATGKQASTTISSSYTDLTGASTSTTLAAGKCLRITYRTVNATTTAKNLALVVGSTTHNIYSASSTSSAFYGQLMFCNDASVQNAQTMFTVIHATAGTAAITLRTKDDWAEDMSTAKTVKLQGKCDTSCSDSVQVYTFIVEKLEN